MEEAVSASNYNTTDHVVGDIHTEVMFWALVIALGPLHRTFIIEVDVGAISITA